MIRPTIKVKIPNLDIKTPDRRFWSTVGDDIILAVEDRTNKGKDADNKPFKPYTKEYAKRRAEKGRSTRVNLQFSGRMLSRLRNKSSKRGVRVSISGGEDGLKAYSINFDQRRQFMAINNKDVKKIYKRIQEWIAKHND